jgi:carbonic anhydrase/acetyltransferase-like protein (isoleucine patch superfamily)
VFFSQPKCPCTQKLTNNVYIRIDESIAVASSRQKENPFAQGVVIGNNTVIGNRVVLNSCVVEDRVTIGDDCKIGEGAIVEDGAVLEKGTIVPAGKRVPTETKWGGNPAKYLGPAHDDHH